MISLDQQRKDFAARRFLAMPLAGTLMWAAVAIVSFFPSPSLHVWTLFIATGCIAYVGMLLTNFTGERFLDKSKPKNTFDSLFFHTVAMSLLVYAIAIPFFQIDYTSLPLTVGILSGLMWLPLSWIIKHWIGVFHGAVRTMAIVLVWYVFPDDRFLTIPLVIISVYAVTIWVLESRWRGIGRSNPNSILTAETAQ